MLIHILAIELLHKAIAEERAEEELDALLWDAILKYQGQTLYTFSGLEFTYMVKRRKNGEYSGELLVSRKETSKTLTRSSVMLAFHKILEEMQITEKNGIPFLIPPSYNGPKSIGQIFGISYIFSLFLEFGLIRMPSKNR